MVLSGVGTADFKFLLSTLSLTNGNLSRHIEKLELAGYIKVNKTFKSKFPNTCYRITKKGSVSLEHYWKMIDDIRRL